MTANILTIGDEILIGQIVDTNSAFIAAELSKVGIKVNQIVSISDNKKSIISSIDRAIDQCELLVITGGLGPTNDDITKYTLASYYGVGLKRSKIALENIKRILRYRGAEFTEQNSTQADVPENCIVLNNFHGTAPGMLFNENNKVIVSLPGVPFEMKALVTDELIPWLEDNQSMPVIKHKTFMTTGVAESTMALRLVDFEKNLPTNMSLAYLPSPGVLKLRLNSTGSNEAEIESEFDKKTNELEKLLGKDLFGFEGQRMEEVIGQLLSDQKATLSAAESCTGGNIAHLITEIPGASNYFNGCVVAYSNDIKINLLGVDQKSLAKHGAVSKEVVVQMAEGIKKVMNTDYSIATSGIAGPTGGTEDKPVGTVWIAISSPRTTLAIKLNFGTHRERTILRSSIAAMNLLRLEINKIVEKTVKKV